MHSLSERTGMSFASIMINCIIAGTFAGIVFTLFLTAIVILLTSIA